MSTRKQIINILVLITILLVTCVSPTLASRELKTHFINVGQGDAVFIQLPNQETMLIDAGRNSDEELIVNYLKKQGIHRLDYVIGTHPHADHIGGLDSVIANFTIGNIYLPDVSHTTQTYKDVLLAVKRKNKKITAGKAGIELVTTSRLQVKLLGPVKNNYENLNNHSIVTKVIYKDTSFLFSGDAEAKAERQIISEGYKIDTDLLKVPHHGSDSSTCRSFLQATDPDYAVLSVGEDNRYGHPSSQIISRLVNQGIELYRTDKQGTIIAVSDGKNISFNVENTDTEPTHNNKATASSGSVNISYLNLETEVVRIKNTGEENRDLSGWKLVSVQGQQTFHFPADTIIKAGEAISVVAGPDATSGSNQFVWDDWYIWNNNGDPAELYDAEGNLVSSHK